MAWNSKVFKERTLSETQWFWVLAFMGLLTRLPWLNLSEAETTDGISCLTYFSPDRVPLPRFVIFPAYPALLWLCGHSVMAGRLISAFAGLLFLIPLWKFSRRWVSAEMAGLTCLLAMISPLLWQWSLKVMPDALFLLFFWWALERLTAAWVDQKESAWRWANLAGIAASLTRPEGILLAPWILLGGERLGPKRRVFRRLQLLGWLLPLAYLAPKLGDMFSAYQEGLGLSAESPLSHPSLNFLDHFYAYLAQPLYVFTPFLFWFGVLGLGKMVRRKDAVGGAFKQIILQVYILLFISRLFPTAYQDRYLLPFLPLVFAAAGFHLETYLDHWGKSKSHLQRALWKNGLLLGCILWLF